MRARSPLVLLLAAASLGAPSPAAAEASSYALELPADEVAFRLPFEVVHPGTVRIEASWSGGRVLSLRLEDPSQRLPLARQSGPSPQTVRLEVAPAEVARGPLQRVLVLRALTAREPARGTLTLTLPDDPSVVRAREEALKPPPPPPPPADPWTVPATAPAGASPALASAFTAVEGLRRAVIAPDGSRWPDACGWQDALLAQAAAWRDGAALPGEVATLLDEVADAVEAVEAMRTSTDPILAGPAPEPGLRRRAWTSLREQQLRPLHARLDTLTERASRRAPAALGEAAWPARLAGCLVAAERHFEDTVVAGPEAPMADLARAQWDPILRAAEALRALAAARP